MYTYININPSMCKCGSLGNVAESRDFYVYIVIEERVNFKT